MLLSEYFENMQKKLCQTAYSKELIIKELNVPFLSTRLKSAYAKKYNIKLGIDVMTGRYATNHILTIGLYLDKDYENNESFIRKIKIDDNPYGLLTYEDFVDLCKKKKEESKKRYQTAAEEYLKLAASLNLNQEQALKLGDAFYRLNPNAKDVLYDKEDSFVKVVK